MQHISSQLTYMIQASTHVVTTSIACPELWASVCQCTLNAYMQQYLDRNGFEVGSRVR